MRRKKLVVSVLASVCACACACARPSSSRAVVASPPCTVALEGANVATTPDASTSAAVQVEEEPEEYAASTANVVDAAPTTGVFDSSKALSPVVYHGDRSSPRVALTFDDGWDAKIVKQALDVAKQKSVPLTFFPVGMRVVLQKQLWKRAVAEGHELGNHSFFHPRLTQLSSWAITQEVRREEAAIDSALGEHYALTFLRPPGGDGGYRGGDPRIVELAQKLGYAMIMWDVETSSLAKSKDAVKHVLKKTQNGSIVLLHLGPRDVGALGQIVDGLRAKGFEPTTVTKLLAGD